MRNTGMATAIAAAMAKPMLMRWLNMAYTRDIPIPIPKSLYLRNVTTSPPVVLIRGHLSSSSLRSVTHGRG